jgi:carbamoyltransferase
MFSELVEKVLPKRRLPDEEITIDHKNVAASAQKVVEDAVFKILELFHKDDDEYLCLAGGVVQNSVLNGKIVSSGMFKDIYVTPVVGDAGSALGAAAVVQVQSGYQPRPMKECYLGSSYSNDYIKSYLEKNRIHYKQYPNIAEKVADDLAAGKIVALFQGRMEFGPRSLGNRSLLANPKIDGMKYKVNVIKNREQFRPFAPAVLHEYGPKLIKHYQNAPFMSLTLDTTDYGYEMLKEATHIDKTARVQSVYPNSGRYRDILEAFYKKTNIPGVLNTSFNVDGQPVVESPQQAVSLFYSTNVDTLILEDFVLEK